MAAIDRDHDRLVADIVTLTEIPAPPFKEDKRGAAYLAMLRAAGLTDVERDAEGNVHGPAQGHAAAGRSSPCAAHLDTVFPEGTDVTVKRDGTRLSAPGIGDDTRSLAVLLGDDPRDGRGRRSRRPATSCSSATSAKKARAICAA